MDHKTREFYPLSDRLKPGYGFHGNNVTVSVVKNVVVNMECVLADLKGIMGEITTIVERIDTVTGRNGKHNKAGNGNRDLSFSKYDFGKFLCGKNSESKLVKSYTAVSPEADNESSQINNVFPSHNVLKVKGVSHHHDFQSDKQQKKYTATHVDGTANLKWTNTPKMLSGSREWNHMVKGRSGIKPYNGAIAVVHPTIINSYPGMPQSENKETSDTRNSVINTNSPPEMPQSENKETSDTRNSVINTNSPPAMPQSENKETSGAQNSLIITNSPQAMPNSSTKTSTQKSIICTGNTSHTQTFTASPILPCGHKQLNNLGSSVKDNSEVTSQDLKDGEYTQNKDEQNIGNACNISVQAPAGAKEKHHSHSQFSRNMCTSLESFAGNFEKPNAREDKKPDMKYSRDVKAQLNSQATSTSHRSVASTEKVNFLPKSSEPCYSQELTFKNTLTRHSSLKSVCSKVYRSPASVKSFDNCPGRDTNSYYYSTESDGESDYCVENHDVRSITPDIDWSYLNLVGGGNAQVRISMVADTNRHDRASERCNSYSVSYRQTNADAEEIANVNETWSVLGTKDKFNNMTTVRVHSYRMMTSLVPIHIFCSEVSSFQSVGYCGYYEAILDSVLENIAGFESFEEACEAIENTETLNEVYASCDTEFEEDDWGIGIKSGYQDKCHLPPSNIHQPECLHLGSLEHLDRNQNILAANTRNLNKYPGSDSGNGNITIIDKVLDAKRNNELTSLAAAYELKYSPKVSERGNTFTENDDGTIQMGISNPNQNLMSRPESICSTELKLTEINTATSDKETDRSSSGVSSCPTDGSPMSFSSSEITYTSQETGQAESASEDDDLNSSNEDSVSLSSEIGYDTQLFIHKAKLKKLRRAFFQSLYRNFDEKEMETDDNYSVTSLDDTTSLGQSVTRLDNNNQGDNLLESESYLDNVTGYNQNINTWTAYALVDLQTDDMSDSASDVFHENNLN